MSLIDLLDQGNRPESKIYGVVVGIVTNNQDPDKMGRVKVKIPRLSADDESNWARIVSIMGGKEMGAFFLPEVDDEVLVAFEYGDINIPYIVGSLWNGKDKPPHTNDDGKNNLRFLKSRSGHIIRLDDTDGKEKIEVIDKSEENMIIIDTKEKKISIKSKKDIEISAPEGKVKIEAKDIEFVAKGSGKMEASEKMEITASGDMKLKGATVNIN